MEAPRSFVLALAAAFAFGCAEVGDGDGDEREAEITSVLARADESLIRSRPALVAGKYARMRADAFDYLRGSLPVYAHDTRDRLALGPSRFALAEPLVLSVGDAHPENFGTLLAADGSLGLEPNDFDTADRAPYLWDVRRLASGLATAASLANEGDPDARAISRAAAGDVARAAVRAYRDAIGAFASGAAAERVTGGADPVLADLFSRAVRDRDARRELADFTVMEGGARHLRRGVLDPADPANMLVDLPPFAMTALGASLRAWRSTLFAGAPSDDALTILDAARELGSGVASFPRVRALILLRGPSDAPDDDLLVELKELSDSHLELNLPPYAHWDDVKARVLGTSRAAWARPDADRLWGVADWMGIPCQLRAESGANKAIRVSRLVKDRGTPDALLALARTLGTLLARIHASGEGGPMAARAVAARIGADTDEFVAEEADVGVAYAATTLDDAARFVRALDRVGPRLGVPFDPSDRPRADLAALFGASP